VLSAKTDSGVDQLLKLLTTEARTLAGEPALVTHARQRHALKESVVRLDAAVAAAVAGQEELVAEELRLAARTLGRVTGRVDVEDVLDEVFRNFCVGK
jgi:tRNA modification GTPase